jgi:putative membrane protein
MPRVERGKIVLFFAGIFVLFIALVSPLDELGDVYWFSAHMTQHLLLTLAGPPLLLLGTPGWLLAPLLKNRAVLCVGRCLTSPVIALGLFNVVFALYHVPALYDLALRDDAFHIFMHLMLMATAVVTWWPVLSPVQELPRLPYPAQILYLFLESIPPTILGALITFADAVLYPTYQAAPRLFDVTALADQQAAGLIMWIPGTMVYLFALTIVFFKWFGQSDSGTQEQWT